MAARRAGTHAPGRLSRRRRRRVPVRRRRRRHDLRVRRRRTTASPIPRRSTATSSSRAGAGRAGVLRGNHADDAVCGRRRRRLFPLASVAYYQDGPMTLGARAAGGADQPAHRSLSEVAGRGSFPPRARELLSTAVLERNQPALERLHDRLGAVLDVSFASTWATCVLTVSSPTDERRRDLLVRAAERELTQHVGLARGQRCPRACAREQLAADRRIDIGLPLRDRANRRQQRLGRRVLANVAGRRRRASTPIIRASSIDAVSAITRTAEARPAPGASSRCRRCRRASADPGSTTSGATRRGAPTALRHSRQCRPPSGRGTTRG